MRTINPESSLAEEIEQTGFICLKCGTCCKETDPDSNLVITGPDEIRMIMEGTGLSFEEIVRPYPELIIDSGRQYTFGWVLRHVGDHCMFLKDNCCMIYNFRPWICRTFPFMISEEKLDVYLCPGTGKSRKTKHSGNLVLNLYKRLEYEKKQENSIRMILQSNIIPTDRPVVIDEEGIKDYYG